MELTDLPVYVDTGDVDDPERPWWVRRTWDVWVREWWRRFESVPFKPSKRTYPKR